MTKNKALKGTATAAAALVVLSACTVATPDTSQTVLHYTGGPFSSQAFEYCTEPGVRSVGGSGDYDYYYPKGQRTFTFSDKPGADAPPIRVSTKNSTELIVRGTVAFTLNTDCNKFTDSSGREWPGGIFQRFHDTIGRQKGAFASDEGQQQPDGWKNVLQLYVGDPAEKAMDNAGKSHNYQDLYGSAEAKGSWEQAVLEELPKLILAQAGAQHFIINNIQIQQPDLPDKLREELEGSQAAIVRQNTSKIDESAAKDWPGGIPGYLAYQQQLAINKAIGEGRANINVVPQGSAIMIGPKTN